MLSAATGIGAALAVGGTIAGLSVGASIATGLGISVGGSSLLGATDSFVNQLIDNNWDINKVNFDKIGSKSIVAGIKGGLGFASGAWTGAAGLWNIPKGTVPGKLSFVTKTILNTAIGVEWKISVDIVYAMLAGEDIGWINLIKKFFTLIR